MQWSWSGRISQSCYYSTTFVYHSNNLLQTTQSCHHVYFHFIYHFLIKRFYSHTMVLIYNCFPAPPPRCGLNEVHGVLNTCGDLADLCSSIGINCDMITLYPSYGCVCKPGFARLYAKGPCVDIKSPLCSFQYRPSPCNYTLINNIVVLTFWKWIYFSLQ